MEKLINAVSNIKSRSSITDYTFVGDSFLDQLNEAIHAGGRKVISFAGKANEDLTDSVDQLVSSVNQINAQGFRKLQIITGMLDLYIAQENKDDRSGRGRLIINEH